MSRAWLPAGTGIDASSPTMTGRPFSRVASAGSVETAGGIETDGRGGSDGSGGNDGREGRGIGEAEDPGSGVPYGSPWTSGAVPSLPVTAVIIVAPLFTNE
jgi:hypothetical protein